MAKRKKSKKSSTRSRRRVGAINTDLQAVGMAVLGAVAANKLSAMLGKQSGFAGQIAPYAGLVAGLAIPQFVKSPIANQISLGLAVGGSLTALKKLAPNLIGSPYQLPVVSGGVYNPNAVGRRSINGYTPARSSVMNDKLSVISGMTTPRFNGTAMGM